jgi:hypothetical protein
MGYKKGNKQHHLSVSEMYNSSQDSYSQKSTQAINISPVLLRKRCYFLVICDK